VAEIIVIPGVGNYSRPTLLAVGRKKPSATLYGPRSLQCNTQTAQNMCSSVSSK